MSCENCKPSECVAQEELLSDPHNLLERYNVLLYALKVIAGKTQCVDNLMSNSDIALEALTTMEKMNDLRHELN